MWISNGSADGTDILKDIYDGQASSNPANFKVSGVTLYFTAYSPASGSELWSTNGTELETTRLRDINDGLGGSLSDNLTADHSSSPQMSVECWVRFDRQGKMPVIASCGVWNQAGWFLQWFGGVWRWHVGGVDCDGGRPQPGRWIHLVGTYDGQTLRLFQDGEQVAERTANPSTAVWPGELYIGQYSGSPAPDYQVNGRITGMKLYHRPLHATEAAAAAQDRPD